MTLDARLGLLSDASLVAPCDEWASAQNCMCWPDALIAYLHMVSAVQTVSSIIFCAFLFVIYRQVFGVSCVYAGLDGPLAGRSDWTHASPRPDDGTSRPESHLRHERGAVLQTGQSGHPHRHEQHQGPTLEGGSTVFHLIEKWCGCTS